MPPVGPVVPRCGRYDGHVSVEDWLFGVLVMGFVALLCRAAIAGGVDLSTRGSRVEALLGSVVLGGGFSLLTGAWIGLCIPAAVVVLTSSGLLRSSEPRAR
jgi:hypothetical protein